MAKTAKSQKAASGKPLVIVESPAKARTIGKFLGSGYTVEASIGHIRDLPQGAAQVPAQYRDKPWKNLGVDVENDFTPIYVIPPGKSKQIKKLKDELKNASALYLATDEDREGEAISWHLLEVLKPKVPVHRLVFHEITKQAIDYALSHAREVDQDLVRAQEARRILDRLFGYEVSPLLWRKVRRGLSAGRVQSAAVRLIVERERQRMAFHSAVWWDLLGKFEAERAATLEATLVSVDGRRIPQGKDFDSSTGKIKNEALALLDETAARALVERIQTGEFRVAKLEEKPYTSRPAPPFTTSTLQQEANRKLGFTARRTMQVAQSLYENGHITYMRTDSTTLAEVAINDTRALVSSEYGSEYVPATPRSYASKVKNAQEAHEAIRPAGHPFGLPGDMKAQLNADQYKIFELVWKRTIASQMADARGRRLSVTIEGEGCVFQVSGKTIDFPGYLRAYVEGSDDPDAELADQEKALPPLVEGQSLKPLSIEAKEHITQPPGRYSEAALTKALEEKGIGRPSTYASIIDTILARNYVFKKASALVPTWVAFAVVRLLENHLAGLVDYEFTAQMEDDLDTISRGEREQVEYLRRFYYGNGRPGLKHQIDSQVDEIDAREISRIAIGQPADQDPVYVRVGRFSPFVEQGERKASLPEDMPPDEVTLAIALELLEKSEKGEEPIGICPDTNKPVFLKIGRFGPYVQRGDAEDEERQNASLLKGMNAEEIDLPTALKLLSLPRELGPNPKAENALVVAHNGRYGPYVKCGTETRSLPADLSPLDVTLTQALELLAQPKQRGRGAAKREPLRLLEDSPVTGNKIQVLEGRYGPYVTDGETNASLPKGTSPEEITHNEAVDLLAARAAKGGTTKKKKATQKKTTKKKAAKKKAAKKKKTATKKAVKKSAARKES